MSITFNRISVEPTQLLKAAVYLNSLELNTLINSPENKKTLENFVVEFEKARAGFFTNYLSLEVFISSILANYFFHFPEALSKTSCNLFERNDRKKTIKEFSLIWNKKIEDHHEKHTGFNILFEGIDDLMFDHNALLQFFHKEFFLKNPWFSFSAKINLLKKVVEDHGKKILKNTEDYFKELEELKEYRNTLAHSLLTIKYNEEVEILSAFLDVKINSELELKEINDKLYNEMNKNIRRSFAGLKLLENHLFEDAEIVKKSF